VQTQGEAAPPAVPSVVRRLDGPEADQLARLTAAYDDLQHVLRCCEHLVARLASPTAPAEADPALVEALWTSALLSYARCFSEREGVLTSGDLGELELPGDVGAVHDLMVRLRDHYASATENPRERLTVGAAEGDGGTPVGVAVLAAAQPPVDEAAVRQLGALAYRLGALVDGRMRQVQEKVLDRARGLTPEAFAALPVVPLEG
jgi:hypothetical protein